MDVGIRTVEVWNSQGENMCDHYQQDLRHAFYVRAILNANECKLLEIAAGSFRDMNALNEWGYDCYGIDYSDESVTLAKKYFLHLRDKISKMDAFELKFKDKEFDLSYHNGFWTYFTDDEIEKLIREQVRVSKYRIVVTVHNKHNSQFVEYFNRLSKKDPLYQLRFFEVDEIVNLMEKECHEVRVIPVGKGKKFFEDDLINIGLGDAQYIRRSFDYHGLNLLTMSERLMCIGLL